MTRLYRSYTQISEDQAKRLSRSTGLYTIEVKPPRTKDVPATVEQFVRTILELQTGLLGVRNVSPLVAYEIHRVPGHGIRIQYCVPTKRVERKVRTQLSNEVPGVGFGDGRLALPVAPGDSVGGGILTTGREDRFPLQTRFQSPPINSVVSSLHRHAMQDTKAVVQILFQPVAGRSLKEWWRKHRSYKTVGFLRKEKEQVWGSRSPTKREKKQADAVEQKISQRRFWVSIRLAVIGAGEYTPSRVKELAGSFNVFENPETGQYLNTETIKGLRQKPFIEFCQAVRDREFGGYSHRFQASVPELASLLSVPGLEQKNLNYSQP